MLYDILDTEIERVKVKNKLKKRIRKIKFKLESIKNARKNWNLKKLKKEQEKMMDIEVTVEETVDKSNKEIDKRAKIIARTEAKLYYWDTGKHIRKKYKNSRALQLKERMYSCLSYNKDYVYQVAPDNYLKVFHDDYMKAYNNINNNKNPSNEQSAKDESNIREEDIRQTVDNIFNNGESKDKKGGTNMSNSEEKFGNKEHNVTGNGSRAIKNKFSDEDRMYSVTKDDIDNPASWVTPIDRTGEKTEIDSKSMWKDETSITNPYERDMPEIPTSRTTIYSDDSYSDIEQQLAPDVQNALNEKRKTDKRKAETDQEKAKVIAEQESLVKDYKILKEQLEEYNKTSEQAIAANEDFIKKTKYSNNELANLINTMNEALSNSGNLGSKGYQRR